MVVSHFVSRLRQSDDLKSTSERDKAGQRPRTRARCFYNDCSNCNRHAFTLGGTFLLNLNSSTLRNFRTRSGTGGTMMLRVLVLSLAAATASAIVCLPDICQRVRCAAVTAENCVGGKVVANGGFCGCCDKCVMALAEGDKCFPELLGVPPSSRCGEGLSCDLSTHTCRKTQILASKRQELSCAERLQQIQSAQSNGLPLLGQFIPKCDQDGTYLARQCQGSVCYCVDPKGVKIEGYDANIGEAANMDCKCARDQYAYMQTGLIGKLFSCTSNGSYQRYACTGSVCYCADNLGAMKTGSPTVNIGNIGDLNC